ncbi:hypothetical protein BIV57_10675 [Mangrovactinospora gilvigrisea]|uniref:Glycosyltransferase RgtA/B/C/D-like domain-containing protein n=1 Tax=Mangrovactinospora gilvigrisea TaxID=1428644 RepID=A0A1J7BVJ5_9ACTN|nr:glycosyltransferase family 39 protein [Mangrovactinospora gilvigrisea]OIV37497.1 hypothetical protein BIV57_10675 [Mangrovactinospora gilvigrisea]
MLTASAAARPLTLRLAAVQWAAVLALGYGLLQVLAQAPGQEMPDTVQYARLALHRTGTPWAATAAPAARQECRDRINLPVGGRSAVPQTLVTPSEDRVEACVRLFVRAAGSGTGIGDPRYTAIFAARPLYPLLAAGPVAVLGVAWGMWLPALACGLLAGMLVFALLRTLGASTGAALAGQLLCYVLPVGFWALRPMSEGPSLAATLTALLGAALTVRQPARPRPGLTLLAVGTAAGFLTRYSTAVLVTAALAAVLLVLAALPRTRTRTVAAAAAVAAAGALAQPFAAKALGWPGTAVTLQDTFTRHFNRPAVAHPWRMLLDLEGQLWPDWLHSIGTQPLLPIAVLAGAVALWRTSRAAAALVLAVAATGLATVAAHPVMTEADRLVSPLWLAAVIGLPLWLPRTPRA